MKALARKVQACGLAAAIVLVSPGLGLYEVWASEIRSTSAPRSSLSLGQGGGAPLSAAMPGVSALQPGLSFPGQRKIEQITPLSAGAKDALSSQSLAAVGALPAGLESKVGGPGMFFPAPAKLPAVGDVGEGEESGPSAASQRAEHSSFFDHSAGDAKKAIVLVGGSHWGRTFLLERPVQAAREIGHVLLLVDEPGNRPASEHVDSDKFFGAQVFSHTEPEILSGARRTAEAIAEKAAREGLKIVGVTGFFDPLMRFAAALKDELKIRHNPEIRGNSYAAVSAAVDKFKARQILEEKAPEVTVPAALVKSPAQAAQAFDEITRRVPADDRVVVIKGNGAAGKVAVKTGIASRKEAEKVYAEVDGQLQRATRQDWAKPHSADVHPGVIMELQINGRGEYDVEVVRAVNGDAIIVIGNPDPVKPHQIERGMTLHGNDQQLSMAHRVMMGKAAAKALDALDLKIGNFHVEMKWMFIDGGWRPVVIEVNVRPVGANGLKLLREFNSWDAIEQGMRAIAGLPIDEHGQPRYPVLVSRKLLPVQSGKILSIEGLEAIKNLPGVIDVDVTKKPGDAVVGPDQGYFDGIFGYIVTTGRDFPDAMATMMKALHQVKITLKVGRSLTNWRGIVVQRGDYAQSSDDEYIGPPAKAQAAFSAAAGETAVPAVLDARSKAIYDRYLKAEKGNKTIFSIYAPLFTLVTKAMGGVEATAAARLSYSGAVTLSAPLSSIFAGWIPLRLILSTALAIRALIWGAIVPGGLWVLGPGAAFIFLLGLMMAMDGLVVSFSDAVNLDNQGLDVLADQYGLPIDNAVRNYYTSQYEAFGAKMQFIGPLGVSLLGIALGSVLRAWGASVVQSAVWAMVGMMAVSFIVPAAWSIYHYLNLPREAKVKPQRMSALWGEFWDGVETAKKIPQIGRRIVLDALERTLWDGMRFLALPAFAGALALVWNQGQEWSALYNAALISASQVGAMLAVRWMSKFQAPTGDEPRYPSFRRFFPMIFLAALSTALIPAACLLVLGGFPWLGFGVATLGSFLFQRFFMPASLGARLMRQEAAKQHNVSTKVAGITASVHMLTHGLSIFALGLLFNALPVVTALWLTVAYFLAIGLFSYLLGPRLLFSREERDAAAPRQK